MRRYVSNASDQGNVPWSSRQADYFSGLIRYYGKRPAEALSRAQPGVFQ